MEKHPTGIHTKLCFVNETEVSEQVIRAGGGDTLDISWTKLCPVDGPVYSKVTCGERSGSVVECLTRDRRAAGSSLTGVTALWSLSKTHLS